MALIGVDVSNFLVPIPLDLLGGFTMQYNIVLPFYRHLMKSIEELGGKRLEG